MLPEINKQDYQSSFLCGMALLYHGQQTEYIEIWKKKATSFVTKLFGDILGDIYLSGSILTSENQWRYPLFLIIIHSFIKVGKFSLLNKAYFKELYGFKSTLTPLAPDFPESQNNLKTPNISHAFFCNTTHCSENPQLKLSTVTCLMTLLD